MQERYSLLVKAVSGVSSKVWWKNLTERNSKYFPSSWSFHIRGTCKLQQKKEQFVSNRWKARFSKFQEKLSHIHHIHLNTTWEKHLDLKNMPKTQQEVFGYLRKAWSEPSTTAQLPACGVWNDEAIAAQSKEEEVKRHLRDHTGNLRVPPCQLPQEIRPY